MKKSFVLYLDQYQPIEKLSLEQKGVLLEAMFSYNSESNYEIKDPIVEIVFGFFTATFDRDLAKYVGRCNKNKESGRKGGKQRQANATKRKQVVANLADSGSGSGSGSGKIVIGKDKKTICIKTLLEHALKKSKELNLSVYDDKISEFITYRMSKPKAKRYETEKGVDGLFRNISECLSLNYDLNECIDIAIENNWQTPKAEYYKNSPPVKESAVNQRNIDDMFENAI